VSDSLNCNETTFIANEVQSYIPPLSEVPRKYHNHPVLSLVLPQSLDPDGTYYITTNPERIDIGQLQKWKAYCDADHHGICHSLSKQDAMDVLMPSRLIDISQSCLINVTDTLEYAALSYVWGNSTGTLTATTKGMPSLCTPGSLQNNQQSASYIPSTILDAMALTKIMGIKYLWVDRFCIVQDDPSDLEKELPKMASIYAESCFTIVAADGKDAKHGLRGIGGQAEPRDYKQTYYEFSARAKLLQDAMIESEKNPSVWHTRGWTFQERAVARRKLVFVDSTVIWECCASTWKEDIQNPPEIYDEVSMIRLSTWPSYATVPHSWPDLRQYFMLVRGYNKRNLYLDSDALNAFGAILTSMNQSFRSGFHFGVPEFCFDIALLWTISGHSQKRREAFPSWSWLGWPGDIEFEMSEAWDPLTTTRSDLRVWPMIKWEKSSHDEQRQVPIDNTYHLYRNSTRGKNDMRSEGWTEKNGEFVHTNIPDQQFRYPFPVSNDLVRPSSDSWSPSLSFRAERCTMFLEGSYIEVLNNTTPPRPRLTINVHDSNGSWTGVITGFTSEDDYTHGDQCELIAISKASRQRKKQKSGSGYRNRNFTEMDTAQEIKELDCYDFYNVLWIEWKEGIAYRKALGRVWKKAWDSQNPTMADIVLG
jgi:hypothetical protein